MTFCDAAVIMAGGQGSRMRHSGATKPKPLIEVGGVTLLERNLQQLLKHGLKKVFVSVHAEANDIRNFVDQRLQQVAQACDARLELLIETKPLGNIGALQLLPEKLGNILVVYADNLTTLDLEALAKYHADSKQSMTIAAHREPFQMPYGELELALDGTLANYVEKPVHSVTVCSALAVVSPTARLLIPRSRLFGISELCRALIKSGDRVSVFEHDAPWIDVNDLSAVARAKNLVADEPAFDLWAPDGVQIRTIALTFEEEEFREAALKQTVGHTLCDHVPYGEERLHRYIWGEGPDVRSVSSDLARLASPLAHRISAAVWEK